MPVSSLPIRCCTDYTVAGKRTVQGKDNKEDNTKEEADMTPSLFFPKVSKAVQKIGNDQRHLKYGFGPLKDSFEPLMKILKIPG